jgi:hypothetical protein
VEFDEAFHDRQSKAEALTAGIAAAREWLEGVAL